MAENVNTGGTKSFDYPKEYSPNADEKLKSDIQQGYAQAEERKRKERTHRLIYITIGLIIALVIISYFILK